MEGLHNPADALSKIKASGALDILINMSVKPTKVDKWIERERDATSSTS